MMMEDAGLKKSEEEVIVLDFLPNGHPFKPPRIPIAQVLGKRFLTLLEVIPKKGVFLRTGERAYIGNGKREEIHHVKGKIKYDDLTNTGKQELDVVLKKLVEEKEKTFVNFMNKSIPLTTRLHQLELIPGIGKKHMFKILDERRFKPFESFKDMRERVELLPDIKQSIIKRIIIELNEEDKYRIFTNFDYGPSERSKEPEETTTDSPQDETQKLE